MADNTLGAYNIFELREMALKRVPKGLFEFVDRGTSDILARVIGATSSSRSSDLNFMPPAARRQVSPPWRTDPPDNPETAARLCRA